MRGTRSAGERVGQFRVDHPRVCGEHRWRVLRSGYGVGSSPRMRGTLGSQLCLSVGVGIIPAYAGNTSWLPPVENWSGDHPRVCGEHFAQAKKRWPVRGSSPRMRGTPPWLLALHGHLGIIPAYAGNTRRLPCRFLSPRDHPRVCGEHPLPSNEFYQSPGSSPRMRGTRQRGRSA